MTPEFVRCSHSTSPLRASKARKKRSLVPPAKTRPPPVVSTGPQLAPSNSCVQTSSPVSMSHAWISPTWLTPGAERELCARSGEGAARLVLHLPALDDAAEVVVRGNVEQARLRAVSRRRPVLSAPERRAERRRRSRCRLVVLVVRRSPGLGVDAGEDVLIHVRPRVHERDAPAPLTLEDPEVAVPAGMDERGDDDGRPGAPASGSAWIPRPSPTTRSSGTGGIPSARRSPRRWR